MRGVNRKQGGPCSPPPPFPLVKKRVTVPLPLIWWTLKFRKIGPDSLFFYKVGFGSWSSCFSRVRSGTQSIWKVSSSPIFHVKTLVKKTTIVENSSLFLYLKEFYLQSTGGQRKNHGTQLRWYLRTYCVRMKENRTFRRKNNRLMTTLDLIKWL